MNSQADIIIAFLFYLVAAFLAYFFLSGFIWGAGFEPTRKKDIDIAAKLLNLHEGMLVYDLGSGTGEVVLHLAREYKVKCVGIEVDPVKAWISRRRVSRAKGLEGMIEIQRTNFLTVNLSKADAIYVFLSSGTKIMKKLEEKLAKELRPGTRIASYVHSFPDLKAEYSSEQIRVYTIEGLKNRTI